MTFDSNCPINEQTADGLTAGRCWFYMPDGTTCPRHGDVTIEIKHYADTGKTTLENKMRERKGMSILG